MASLVGTNSGFRVVGIMVQKRGLNPPHDQNFGMVIGNPKVLKGCMSKS